MKYTKSGPLAHHLSLFVSIYLYASVTASAMQIQMLPPMPPIDSNATATDKKVDKSIQIPSEDMPPAPPSATITKPKEPIADANKSAVIQTVTDANSSAIQETNGSTITSSEPNASTDMNLSVKADSNETAKIDSNTTAKSDINGTKPLSTGRMLDIVTISRDDNISQEKKPEKRQTIASSIEEEEYEEAKAPTVVDKGETISVNLQELDISEFVKMVSRIIGKNILLNQPISGKVDFITNGPVYKSSLMSILHGVLDSKGFAIVANDDYLQIVRNSDLSRYNAPIGKDSYGIGQMLTEVIKVKSENVDIMASKIRPYLSMAGKLTTTKETNSMLITDYPDNIKTARKLIKTLELSSKMEVDFVRLKYLKLTTVAPNLQKIIQSLTNPRVDTEKVELIQDTGTNSFIVVASKKNIELVRQIIDKMDAKDNLMEQQIYVLPIKNTDAKLIMPALTGIINTKLYTAPSVKPSLSSDDTTNSVIVVGTRADVDEIKSIVKVLDQEKQQVYIVAKIMEISDTKARALGIKYGLEAGKATSNGLFSLAANLGGPSFSISPTLAGYIKPSNITEGLALGASISLLGTEGAANVVSEPTILCIDNKESTIFVGETVSLLTSTVAGTSSTDLARSTFARESIGLTLKVKPRISNDQKVNLNIEARLEDIKPGTGGDGRPNTTKREVRTEIVVNNGETAIIGGLVKDKQTNQESKIPLLGDIPILGYAFKEDVKNNDSTNLVIVLTPYVVSKSSDLTTLRERLSELNDLQNKFTTEIMDKLKKNRR